MSKRYVSLASKIVMILIVSSISAVLVYSCFREQISHYYSFVDDIAGIKEKRTKFFKDFKEKAKDVNLTDKKKIKKLIKTKDPYLSVYIYDNVDEYYVAGNYATVLTEPVSMITPLYILQKDFETDAYNMVYTKTIQFKDQKAEVELYDLNLLKYIKYYFYAALFASFLTFLLPTFFFIRHKVKYIECFKQEILNMSHVDLSHPMTIQGRDELAVLAHQMDGLRVTLEENYEEEKEMQQTHHDLITAMSHDLRTPLTSLRGYLDILALHCFKDQEQMDNYLHRCIDKVEQIKELSRTSFDTLLEAGCHFGHLKRKWNPAMAPYIFMERNGIHIIDLHKTVAKIDEAAEALKAIAKQGKRVLFVATKKQAKEVVADKAASVNMPYVTERWPGGMLTNFPTIRKAIKKMANIDKLMNDGTYSNLSKREILQISRQRAKLEKNLGSISDLTRLPAALFVVGGCKEHIAVKEAQRLGIPVFGIVDTNSDPNVVDYIIPANDDSNKSIEVILDAVCGAIAEGIEERKAEKVDAEAAGEGEAKTRNKRASKARADKDEAAEAPAAEAKAE